MKHIRETFEDAEFKRLLKAKGDLSWHDFIMTLADGSAKEAKKNE